MLEELQQHESTKIYEKTLKILETYFANEDDEEENAPSMFPNNHNNVGGPVTFGFKASTNGEAKAPPAPVSFNFGMAPPQAAVGGGSSFDFSNLASC